MIILHSFSEIKPVCVFSKLVAGDFNLRTVIHLSYPACFFEHAFSDSLVSETGVNGKFHDFCNAGHVMKLVLEPQIQNTYYAMISLSNKTIIMPVVQLITVDLLKPFIRKISAFHIAD